MRFVSTRSTSPPLTLSEAVQASIAPDGGLYVPASFPAFEISDFDGMDSCCGTYVNNTNGYLGQGPATAPNPLFDGNDTTIDNVAFGDGELDVADVFVTFRRSLDPQRVWFQRFWTNGVRAAQFTTNGEAIELDDFMTVLFASLPSAPELTTT